MAGAQVLHVLRAIFDEDPDSFDAAAARPLRTLLADCSAPDTVPSLDTRPVLLTGGAELLTSTIETFIDGALVQFGELTKTNPSSERQWDALQRAFSALLDVLRRRVSLTGTLEPPMIGI
jgi:hypothetical protein